MSTCSPATQAQQREGETHLTADDRFLAASKLISFSKKLARAGPKESLASVPDST